MVKKTKENIIIKIVQVIYLLFIASWFLIIQFNININPILNILTNIWCIILLTIFGLISIILLIKYRVEFIIIFVCIILSVRLLGAVAFWGWLIYGIYRLWLLDQKPMKTILVDAVNAFVIKGEGIFEDMHKLLDEFSNRKIILTGANEEEMDKFGLHNMPYELFTLKHNPEKTDPEYYKKMLENFNLKADEVIYFEHNPDAVKSAESAGIKTFYYDKDKKDLEGLKGFIEGNI